MITVVVLTHNNETTITRTLESIAWCDGIIVIDDYSTDKTVSIVKKFTKKIFQRHVSNDFSSQRNFGLAHATSDWVLFVDSDEVVSQKLASEIQEAVKSGDGYYIKRNDFLFGRWLKYGETGRMKLLRLARKDKGVWQRPVHEVWNITGVVGTLKNPLHHFPHPNVAQFINKINVYSSINAKYLFDQKIKVQAWHIVAYPKFKFLKNYFWYLGFLDRTAGAVVALIMSLHSFLTRAKLWLLWHKK